MGGICCVGLVGSTCSDKQHLYLSLSPHPTSRPSIHPRFGALAEHRHLHLRRHPQTKKGQNSPAQIIISSSSSSSAVKIHESPKPLTKQAMRTEGGQASVRADLPIIRSHIFTTSDRRDSMRPSQAQGRQLMESYEKWKNIVFTGDFIDLVDLWN